MKRASGVRRLGRWSECVSIALAALAMVAPVRAATIPVYGYQVIRSYPHDVNAFTQGLFYKDGFMYESTGLLGRSSVRKVRLETGEVLLKADLPAELFGEGITYWDQRLFTLTWYSQVGYVLDLPSFTPVRNFSYKGEGWGLARNDRHIIMSDGTPELRFLDPQTLSEVRRLRVIADGKPVSQLNELEWVEGQIFANVWQTDLIARIDPVSGQVIGWINLAGILPASDRTQETNVLNAIAYDASSKRLFVTGKLWPKIFEIKLLTQPKPAPRR